MLSDEVIEKVTERLVNRIEQGNAYVLEQIGKSIHKVGTLTPSKARDLEQILKYGGDYEKIVRKLAQITKLNIKDIKKIFKEVAKNDYQFAEQFYKYRGKKYIPFDENIALNKKVDAITNTMIRGYISKTKSIGFSIKDAKGNITFKSLKKTYRGTIDQAIINISQGKTSFDTEMRRIMRELGGGGIKVLDYKSGRTLRLDSAVRMMTQDALRQLHNEEQEMFGKEFDADGVEISVHMNPAPDHEKVQGKQFSTNQYDKKGKLIKKGEFEKFQSDEDSVSYDGVEFPATSVETGQDRRSISQYNCYHYVFAIILGVSEQEYTNKQLQKIIDNSHKKFKFEGKTYTRYQGTQLQRKLETAIRKQKDIQIIARASNDKDLISESQNKIDMLTRKYNKLSKTSGLPTKIDRMRVEGFHRVAKSKLI